MLSADKTWITLCHGCGTCCCAFKDRGRSFVELASHCLSLKFNLCHICPFFYLPLPLGPWGADCWTTKTSWESDPTNYVCFLKLINSSHLLLLDMRTLPRFLVVGLLKYRSHYKWYVSCDVTLVGTQIGRFLASDRSPAAIQVPRECVFFLEL